jgi:hypothetical protein
MSKNQELSFIVSSSDWTENVSSPCFLSAAVKGLKQQINKNKEKTNLSFIISVEKQSGLEKEVDIFYTSEILAELGLHKLSKELSQVSDFFLDKGKNHC